jgi:hypothetical protein
MTTKNAETALACVGVIALIPVLIVVGAIVDGFVVRALWGWFVAPTFGLPLLSLPLAIGVALTVRALRPNPTDYKRDDSEWYAKLFGGLVISPAFTLATGYVVHRLL